MKVYMGVLSQKCVVDFPGVEVLNDSTYHAWILNESSW
jgi:hypothetical protein